MTKEEKAVADLAKRGYSLEIVERINGGINSQVLKAKTGEQTDKYFIIKIYPNPDKEAVDRFEREKIFLEHGKSQGINNIPTIEEADVQKHWILMSYLEGLKPLKLEKNDYKQIAGFIAKLNDNKGKKANFVKAKECLDSPLELIENLRRRVNKLLMAPDSPKTNVDAKKWLRKIITPEIEELTKKKMENMLHSRHWKQESIKKIISPSDVGIHNTIKRYNKLYFVDFEYAGTDDMSKLAADWLLQPNHVFSRTEERNFIEVLKIEMEGRCDEYWTQRLEDIKGLIRIKWCLIMLNKMNTNSLKERQLDNAIKYHKQTKGL